MDLNTQISTSQPNNSLGIRSFFDSSKGITLIVSLPNGIITYCNTAACSFYKQETEQLIGCHLNNVSQTNSTSQPKLFEKALQNLNQRFCARQTLADGQIKEIELFCNQVAIEGCDYLFVQIHDITKQSADELRQLYNANSLQPIFNSLPNILIRTTEKGEILNTNLPVDTNLASLYSTTYGIEYGKILGCIYSLRLENGCGTGNVCKHCELRNIITRTFDTQQGCPASVVKLHAKTKTEPLQDRYYEAFTNFMDHPYQPTVLISISDVTERLRTAQKLDISQAQLWALVESNTDFIWAVEPEKWALTMFNSSVNKFMEQQFQKPMFADQTPKQLFPPSVADQMIVHYQAVLQNGAFTTDLFIDEYNIVLYLSFNRIEVDGKTIGISVFGKDISQIKAAQYELQQQYQLLNEHKQELDIKQTILESQNEQLEATLAHLQEAKKHAEESDRLKSAILANMSHEIRTPLNAINGFADLLLRPNVQLDKRNIYTQMMKQSGNQLLKIVTNLIEASRLEAEQVQVLSETVILNSIFIELYDLTIDLAKQKNIELLVEIDENEKNVQLQTDSMRLKQIIGLLLDNALKFTHRGTIRIGYKIENEYVKIFVADTGIGIPSDKQQDIFETFKQAEMGINRGFGGNGLGLSIVKKLCHLLECSIIVESIQGKGSLFYFSLPISSNSHNMQNATNMDITNRQLPKIILIAEDEDMNYWFLEALFDAYQTKIIRAKNGQEAINLCEKHPEIEMVLMDVKMPTIDGFEATKQIKKSRPKLPIIATTAFGLPEDKAMALSVGCNNYISKPIATEALLTIVEQEWIISKFEGTK